MPAPFHAFEIRDWLAMDRTLMANERTLLSYLRTSLGLLAAGATLLKLFPDRPPEVITGCVTAALGLAIAVVGVHRFRKVRARYRPFLRDPDFHVWQVGDRMPSA